MPAEREQQLPVLAGPGYAEQHDAGHPPARPRSPAPSPPAAAPAKLDRIGPAADGAADQDHQLADISIADANSHMMTGDPITGTGCPAQPPHPDSGNSPSSPGRS
jgi:hypothetical protein